MYLKITLHILITLGIFSCHKTTEKKSVVSEIVMDSLAQKKLLKLEKESTREEIKVVKKYLDPTGTYELVSKTIEKDGEVYGYTGTIQVKTISKEKIVVSFGVCKGAPSYNLGEFVDTLEYFNNEAVYTVPMDIDPTCKITYQFEKKGVMVVEETADYNCGCGFGHAVVADGFYKRISTKTPKLAYIFSGEKL